MIPLIVALAAQAASMAYSAHNNNKRESALKDRQDKLDNWYNSEYNKDYLQGSEAQSAIKTVSDRIKKNNTIADNKAAVTGQTDESRLYARNNNEERYSDFINKLAGKGDAYKRYVQSRYDGQQGAIQNNQDAITDAKNASTSAAISNLGNIASNSFESSGSVGTNKVASSGLNSTSGTYDIPETKKVGNYDLDTMLPENKA